MTGKYSIKRGSHPICYKDHLEGSEGVDFIIEQAMASITEDTLWLIMLGPATVAAIALEKEPKIPPHFFLARPNPKMARTVLEFQCF